MQISFQSQPAIQLHPDDHVAIALMPLAKGRALSVGKTSLRLAADITAGHKIALVGVEAGAPVRRYGQIIGFATRPILPGEHVHSHNLAVRDFDRNYEYATELRPIDYLPAAERRTFQGYRRADGRAGTRNYIALISSVNCSASTVRYIAERFRGEALQAYPNVDGVLPLTHKTGCATKTSGYEIDMLRRTLAGFARHPNIAAFILVGLGCETNQIMDLVEGTRLFEKDGSLPPILTLQDVGGIAKTVEKGVEMVAAMLPNANDVRREPLPLSELTVALQCGGSDAFSGITANPALGWAVDELVRHGGTGVLSETPELYGAEHLLTRRAVSREVGEKLIERIRWWEDYTARNGFVIDNNPAPGNKAGGLTTIYEKSLGAAAKGGTMPLAAVYQYAEPITEKGMVIMDTPGYDPVSATGQVAGGANLIVFTTGRGSCFGFKPAPSIKVATNTPMYQHMLSDMDVNAGVILEGTPLESVGRDIFERMIAVASGEKSKSEAQGVGEEEFNPWVIGATM
jgi:altronate hydrolase